jgi:putative membrane protein
MDLLSSYYQIFKALHIIAVISWMAGMLYLPRLFVYHSMEDISSKSYTTFLTMERKLLKFITVPAMVLTYIFGIICSYIYGVEALGPWFHIKVTCVLALTIANGMFAIWYRNFLYKQNKYSPKFFRMVNEIPTILMIIAVFMVVLKPLE